MTVVSAVVVTWNSADDVASCISALRRAAQHSAWAVEIIVVDNASIDRSAELAGVAGADEVIVNPLNIGFAAAASLGAGRSHGEWVLFVDPDLHVDVHFFEALRVATTANPTVGSYAPEVRFASDPTMVDSRGLGVDCAGIPFEVRAQNTNGTTHDLTRVFGGSGGAWLIGRSILERHGAFEPAFFAYMEDVDLAWRLQKRGHITLLVPNARALHGGSSTTGVTSPNKAYLVARTGAYCSAFTVPSMPALARGGCLSSVAIASFS